ncbi:MAG: ATPase [Pseudomonadota bacterium]
MKLSKQEFLDQPSKRISLIGMSGVGKSYISSKLEGWGWANYSCDHLIATKYLADKVEGAVSADNIVNLSSFVGQIGDPDKGGVPLEEFKRRQQMYYDAECAVLKDLPEAVGQADGHFVNDSSGSLCEVQDQSVLDAVGQKTLFIYLRVRQADHAEILERAVQYPKPLYFPPAFFEERLKRFLEKFEIETVEEIDPPVFLSWVFPHLFESRLPKYKALADQYGVTISTGAFTDLNSEEDFINIIADHLDE